MFKPTYFVVSATNILSETISLKNDTITVSRVADKRTQMELLTGKVISF